MKKQLTLVIDGKDKCVTDALSMIEDILRSITNKRWIDGWKLEPAAKTHCEDCGVVDGLVDEVGFIDDEAWGNL